jgi:hypothetical protein
VEPRLTLEAAQHLADHIDEEARILPKWIDKIDSGGYQEASLQSEQFLKSQEAYRKIMERKDAEL